VTQGGQSATQDQHTNLLSGRKVGHQQLDASMLNAPAKENGLKRKSSDKKFYKTPNNMRNSACMMKSNNPSQACGLNTVDKQKQPSPSQVKQASALSNALRETSPPANPAALQAAQQMFSRKNQNTVVIHVCDESKKKTQDFKCERSLLLNHMKYFEKYLAD